MDQRTQEQETRRLGATGAQSSRGTLAALHKLQHLRTEAARTTTQIVNAPILEDGRAASTQFHWMLRMICKGAALNIVLLAGDSEWLEAWRQLTDKVRAEDEGKIRRTADVHLVVLTARRGFRETHSLEWEIATFKRDSGKVLDDEVKTGTFLIRNHR